MHGGGDPHAGWRVPEGGPGAAPPAAWPDGTPAGGPPPVSTPTPSWAPPAAPPAWGPPPPGGLGRPPIPPPEPGTRPSRGRSLLAGLAVLLAVVAVAVAVVMADPMGVRSDETAVGWRDDASEEDLAAPAERPADRPTTTTTTTTEAPTTTTAPPIRLAPEVPIPAETGPHVFLATERDGDPVAWDPCDPIRFVVNSRLAPPGAPEILGEAMARVSAATGLVFEDAGPSDEPPPPDARRPPRDAARYGDDWSPVLVSWTDASEVPGLVEYAGLAQPVPVGAGGGEAVYVTGHVELDVQDVADMLSRGDREYVVALVMHELGHLVGLDHVREVTEVMTDDVGGVVALDWGPGDRVGLATLGRGDCHHNR